MKTFSFCRNEIVKCNAYLYSQTLITLAYLSDGHETCGVLSLFSKFG